MLKAKLVLFLLLFFFGGSDATLQDEQAQFAEGVYASCGADPSQERAIESYARWHQAVSW